jgi:hypothetical protein
MTQAEQRPRTSSFSSSSLAHSRSSRLANALQRSATAWSRSGAAPSSHCITAISLYSMLRARFPAVRASLTTRPLLAVAPAVRFASGSSSSSSEASPDELQAARKWLAQLHAETIPKSIGELSFSRSSGPGGQNVNKYASAASMRLCGSALR